MENELREVIFYKRYTNYVGLETMVNHLFPP